MTTTHDLPPALVEAIRRLGEGRSGRDVTERSARISAHYRAGKGSSGVVRQADDVLAYAVARMPATFAAAARACREAETILPRFRPRTALDAGAGPGTAGFAAAGVWPLASLTQLDHNPAFLDAARSFATALGNAAPFPATRQVEADLGWVAGQAERFDLVLAGYVLAETAAVAAVTEALWSRCAGVLVLVEPGTPDGYRRIIAARERLLALGGRLAAPCPHEAACPLVAPDWCHFTERLARRRAHMAAKGASVPFEDEKFSYLVAARDHVFDGSGPARIIDRPLMLKPGLRLKLCRPDGSAGSETIGRRERERFALARRLDWGDTLGSMPPPSPLTGAE